MRTIVKLIKYRKYYFRKLFGLDKNKSFDKNVERILLKHLSFNDKYQRFYFKEIHKQRGELEFTNDYENCLYDLSKYVKKVKNK